MKYILKFLLMATFLASAQVQIGATELSQVASVEITDDWRELGSTCVLELPLLRGRVDKEAPQESLADLFAEGDPVSVELSWKGKTEYRYPEFSGFVRRVSPSVPLRIECEDQLYWCKRTNLLKGFTATSFRSIVQYVLTEVDRQTGQRIPLIGDVPEIQFKSFRFNDVTAAQALQEFRKKYGLAIYFKAEGLFCGLAYTDFRGEAPYNFYGDILKHDLKWRKERANDVRIKATSLLKDNRQLTVEVPSDGTGAIRSRYYAGIESKSELRLLAEKDRAQLSREGFEGSLTSYIKPFVRPGYTAVLTDPEYDNRSGRYHVDKVVTSFMPKNGRGIRRKVDIGIRLV